MSEERDLKGKNVVATGGASGITRAICDHFLKKGINKLAILDLNEEAGDRVASEFNEVYGAGKVVFKKCNVIKEDEMDSAVDEIFKSFGSIDVFVNGAGVLNEGNLQLSLSVNLAALIYLTYKVRNLARSDRGGKGATIINLSSIYGVRPVFYTPIYVASKFGVVGFGKSLGHKFHHDRTKVRILTICPGVTDTPILTAPNGVSDPPDLPAVFAEHIKNEVIIQSADHFAAKTVDLFENGDSGGAWVVENSTEPYEV